MGSVCIITDSSAQFTNPGILNNRGLKVLTHKISYSEGTSEKPPFTKVSDFPRYVSPAFSPRIEPPPLEEIQQIISGNLSSCDDIFIITLSSEISPLFNMIESITKTIHGHARMHLIDSMSTSLGLGLIVEYASRLVEKGLAAPEIEKLLRLNIPHVYMLLCTPNLSYLHAAGILDKGQAVIGEMMSLCPLFLIEEGKLNPLQKVKNQHGAVDYFIEFVDEFEKLSHVALVQPIRPVVSEVRVLHQHVNDCFPGSTFTEHPINPYLASLIGPRGYGMAVMEDL